jgi:ferredoxin-NADP reductase
MFTDTFASSSGAAAMTTSQTPAQTSPRREPGLVRLAALLASPLLPDDYIELVNPLWTRNTLRARVVAVIPETTDSASLALKPGLRWQGHRAGQFLRVGVDIEGVRHWRCYSISSAPERADGLMTITVKAVDGGRVSKHLVHALKAGALLELAAAEGEFVWPQVQTGPLLTITGGSGLTPVMSQLRSAAARGAMPECTVIHYAPTAEDCLFRDELLSLAAQHPQLKLHLVYTRCARTGVAAASMPAALPPCWQPSKPVGPRLAWVNG